MRVVAVCWLLCLANDWSDPNNLVQPIGLVLLHFLYPQRPDDTTSLQFKASTISSIAHEAAVKGHVDCKHARGHGKPLEEWMKTMTVGAVGLELKCEGGNVVVRDDDEEVLDQQGMKKEPLESICVEIPVPVGLHLSFIMRMLNGIVDKGRAQGKINWKREQEELEARRLAALKRPSFIQRLGSKLLGRGTARRASKVKKDKLGNGMGQQREEGKRK